jgi:hypothetical protein
MHPYPNADIIPYLAQVGHQRQRSGPPSSKIRVMRNKMAATRASMVVSLAKGRDVIGVPEVEAIAGHSPVGL